MKEGELRVYENIVEPILDHEIYPSEILPSYTAPDQATLLDIRQYAHDLALTALTRVRGEQHISSDPPDTQEITAARNIMGSYLPELRVKLSRAHYLHCAKNQLEAEEVQDPSLQLRADFQYEMVYDIWRHMQMVRLPPHQALNTDVQSTLETGVVVVAPTGSGKTYIIAKALQLCGVGRVLGGDSEPQSALVSVPTLELVEQYASNDNRNIFRRIIGWDVPIGEYHGRSKEQSVLTLITHRSLHTASQKGDIQSTDYDYTAIDEVHHGLAPKTFPVIRSLRGGLVGTTATPAYNPSKDVRRYFPHVDGGSARDFIEMGILNPTRLFSFSASNSEHAADIGATLAVNWINQGLRTLIYCESGGQQLQARKLATHINAILGENVVRAVGSYRGNSSDHDINLFRSGELKGLTTTGKLKEGFDDNVDAVIVLGCRTSLVDISQMVGRALRRGDKTSRVAEIIPPNIHRLNQKSIWDVFGLEVMRQGQLISPKPGHEPMPSDNLRGNGWKNSLRTTPEADWDLLDDIPDQLQGYLYAEQPVRTALLAPNVIKQSEDAPEGYVLADIIATEFETTTKHALSMLVKAGVGIHKSWLQIGRERVHELWFAPEAREYFKTNPPLQVAHSDAMRISQLTELTGLSRQFFVNTAKRLAIEPKPKLIIGGSQTAHFYSPEDVAKILDVVDGLPFASKTDVPIGELANETSEHFVRTYLTENAERICAVSKRRHPEHGIKGITDHLTQKQAAEIITAYKQMSGKGRMSLTEISDAAGVSLATVSKSLTHYERSQLRSHHGGGKGSRKTMAAQAAAIVIERLKRPDAAPPHMAPSNFMSTRFQLPKTTYKRWLRTFDPEFEYLKISGTDVIPLCVRWDAYRQLEGRFPVRAGSPEIDYRRLPSGPSTSEESALYARTIIDYYGLALPENDLAVPLVLRALHITPYAINFLTKPGEVFLQKKSADDEQFITAGTMRALFKMAAQKSTSPPPGYVSAQETATRLTARVKERSAAAEIVRRAIANPAVRKCFMRPRLENVGDVYLEYTSLQAAIAS